MKILKWDLTNTLHFSNSLLFIIYTILFFLIELLSNKFPHLTKLNWLQRFKKGAGGWQVEGREEPSLKIQMWTVIEGSIFFVHLHREQWSVFWPLRRRAGASKPHTHTHTHTPTFTFVISQQVLLLFLTNTWLFVAKLQLPLFPASAHILSKWEHTNNFFFF